MSVLPALLVALLLPHPPQSGSGFPRAEEFARQVRKALQLDYQILQHVSYIERRRDVRVSKLGKVTIGPVRTFEVFPAEEPGRTYKRLIAVDDRPLSPEDLQRRDAERQRDLAEDAARARRETAQQRAARLAQAEDERRQREALLDDAVAVYQPTFVATEVVEGRRVIVANLKPRAEARVTTREGRWMKHFEGRVWVDESLYQIVRLEMRAFEAVTIGWGIIGRLHRDSSLLYTRQRFEQAWVPAELTYRASGRTLLFRPFDFSVTTTYSGYKRR